VRAHGPRRWRGHRSLTVGSLCSSAAPGSGHGTHTRCARGSGSVDWLVPVQRVRPVPSTPPARQTRRSCSFDGFAEPAASERRSGDPSRLQFGSSRRTSVSNFLEARFCRRFNALRFAHRHRVGLGRIKVGSYRPAPGGDIPCARRVAESDFRLQCSHMTACVFPPATRTSRKSTRPATASWTAATWARYGTRVKHSRACLMSRASASRPCFWCPSTLRT
jgi:hypothetical protein